MTKHHQVRALTLSLALALGAGGTGVALAQDMGGGMMGDDQGSTDAENGGTGSGQGMGPGMGMGSGQGMGPGRGMGSGKGMGPCQGMGPGKGMGSGKGMGPGKGMGHGKGMGPGMGMMQEMRAMREMLSDQQRGELNELMQEHRPAQTERREQMMDLREDMMAEFARDRPDPDTVREMHGRMAQIRGQMLAEQVRMRNAMYGLLTDDQRQQLRDQAPKAADDRKPQDTDS